MKIPEQVKSIIETLEENGYEAYAVGGCVRDTLLGRVPDDWDITTSANPIQVKALFRRTIDTGIQHGTVTVMIGDDGYEVTTYRMDGEYEDHRHPKEVLFTPNLNEDLKRRDFTINAMAYNPRVGIIDLYGGREDLEKKVIRCVGEANERFDEDALRMLRGIRFAGQLQFELEEKTFLAIKEKAPTLVNVSAERIRTELTKLIVSKGSDKLLLAVETGLSAYFLPELEKMLATTQENPHHCFDVGHHSLAAISHINDLGEQAGFRTKERVMLAYAALLHDVAKPDCKQVDGEGIAHFYKHPEYGAKKARGILRRLKFDNETVATVTTLIRYHDRRHENCVLSDEPQPKKAKQAMRRLMNQAGTDLMPLLFTLQQADLLSQSEYKQKEKLMRLEAAKRCYREICEAGEAVCVKDLAIGGRELIQMGMTPGPAIGEMLQQLLEHVLAHPEDNEKEKLLFLAKEWKNKRRGSDSMFHNSRKTIGVFLERSASEFQNRLCQGIITEAKELGYNVAVFSDYGNYGQNDRYFIGDQTLWELPPYEELDGVVLALDTMEEIDSREHVIKNIRERCHCPIISIRELLVGANNLLVDNSSCMEGLIDHFVKEHGMKKLCFMTGPKDHWDAQERLLCFKRKMDEYGLSYGEHQIFYGDFWKNKGKEACDWFLAEGEPQPEGIICANDHMATAVASELIHRGYRIPEDIAVSGYDGMRSTLSFTPCITTATVPFFEMGRRAVQIIDKKQDCPEKVENVFFDAVLQPRESCGCMASEGQEVMQIRQRMYETDNISQNREMQFHFMSIHMSECHTIDEVGQKIGRYIYNIEGFKDYCMCLCEGWLEKKEFKGFTDKMEMPIAIRNRENISPTRERFDRRELIPKCMSSEEPQMWFLAPLHFQDLCFGYEALQFIDVETTGRLYMYWNIIIGNLLQDIMTYQKMQKLVVKLEEMYDRDALTGMYNRRGFENRGNPMFEKAKEEGKQIFLAIIDMDGMKQINDNYGHIEGNYALKKVREAIYHACPDAVIQARTGGDEFEIIAKDIAENEGVHYLEELVAYLDAFNESGGKEYDIHASYGYACRVPSQQDTMEIFIKESDEIMYRNKVINKINRGEALR